MLVFVNISGLTEDTRYDVVQTKLGLTIPATEGTEGPKVTGEWYCAGISIPPKCDQPSAPPMEETAGTPLHYAQMVETPEEPNYENTLILPGLFVLFIFVAVQVYGIIVRNKVLFSSFTN